MTEEVEKMPLSIIARNPGKGALTVYLHTHSTIVGGNTWSLSRGLPIRVHIGQGEKLSNPRNRYHCVIRILMWEVLSQNWNPWVKIYLISGRELFNGRNSANVPDRSMGALTR